MLKDEENLMKTRVIRCSISIATVAVFVLASAPLAAEPVGKLPPLSDFTKQVMASEGKTVNDLYKSIPSKETVGMAVYPDSLYCTEMSGEGMLPTVILASADPIEKVNAWHAEQASLTWSDMWGVFYVGDEYVMMQSESVVVMDISEDPQASACGLAFDMTGMKTQISISYQPKTDAK
jgi:hypothetical protein